MKNLRDAVIHCQLVCTAGRSLGLGLWPWVFGLRLWPGRNPPAAAGMVQVLPTKRIQSALQIPSAATWVWAVFEPPQLPQGINQVVAGCVGWT